MEGATSSLEITATSYWKIFEAASRLKGSLDSPSVPIGIKRPHSPFPLDSDSKRPRHSSPSTQPLKILTFTTTLNKYAFQPAFTTTANRYAFLPGYDEKGSKALVDYLVSNPSLQAPTVLSKVDMITGNHGLTLRLEESTEDHSLTELLNIRRIDKDDEYARVVRAKGAALGLGGLLDAVVYLSGVDRSGVSCSHELSVGMDRARLVFNITTTVYVHEQFFGTQPSFSGQKQILIQHLFPPSPPPTDLSGHNISVDYFYQTLRRAPRTKDGLPTDAVTRKGKERELSDDEKRRKAKGKEKARDQDGIFTDEEEEEAISGAAFEEEDELVRPEGLKATLMPFQSRTVRWMLGREGKIVLPSEADEDGREPTPPPRDDDEDDEMEEERTPLIEYSKISDLPEETLKEIRRGPLWEKAFRNEEEFWINRVACAVMKSDPGELEEAGGVVKRDESVDIMDVAGDEDEKKPTKKRTRENVLGRSLVAEEMGLGKTMEVISLILLHRLPERNALPVYHNDEVDSDVQPSNMTLIVAPTAIVSQWASELAKFAPSLRVLRYEGIKSVKETFSPQNLNEKYDIMLTTFDVLRREVVLARKPHQRTLRSGREARHKYRRSMLVQLDFLRVVIDEIQMVGDTVSATSETASLIPRKYSLAVTGTPVNKIEDVQSLLRFLQVEPVGSSRSCLLKLLDDAPTFVRVVQQLGARTLKAQVEHELVIPRQERLVVPVEFGPVEKYWYDIRYREALDQLGLHPDGTPRDDWLDENDLLSLNKGDMNRWLVVLRQICGHPQVGEGNRQKLGNVLKTVDDVLSTMRENAVSAVQSDLRTLWAHRTRRGQYQMWDKEDCERFEDALAIFQEAVLEVEPLIEELVHMIRATWQEKKAEKMKRARSASAATASDDAGGIEGALALGFDEEERITDGIPQSDKERALTARLTGLRGRLREFLMVQHSARFFMGSAYFNLGKFETEETEAYALAERLRQTILGPWEARVEKSTVRLKLQMDARDTADELTLDDLEFRFSETGGGIVAREAFESIEVTSDILNGWAELIWQWRDMVLQMLYTRVSIAGDNATGEEYADRAELQEKLDCYLQAYGILLSDWRAAITGERSALADALDLEALDFAEKRHEIAAAEGSKRKREKKAEKKRVPLKDRIKPSVALGDTPADILRYELLVERIEAKGDGNEEVEPVPIRHLVATLKDTTERKLRAEERDLVELEAKRLRRVLAVKEKILDRLRVELVDMTRAHNTRIEYFAQLQAISDDVADPNFQSNKWKGLQVEMLQKAEEENKLEDGLKKKQSQRRYLESLEANSLSGAEETYCIICQDTYTKGVLTSCGHIFCQTCFNAWNHQSHTCAICKKPLKSSDYEIVRYRRKEAPATDLKGNTKLAQLYEDGLDGSVVETPVRLRTITGADLDKIEEIASANPLSSKSDLIVKHVKHLRRDDPTTKIVIFSAWTESLAILQQAFTRNGIGFVRLEGSGKKDTVVTKFIKDPNIAVFFLHTKSQSAGLNLTCAQYVFLVEPLLHPALELQAVARVHRVGQTQETTVFQYYVNDTVDQRVAELRGRQRSSLFLPTEIDVGREARILQADMTASSSSKSKGAKTSEEAIDDEDDISRCLFEPAHFLALQRALLPAHLRGARKTGGGMQPTLAVMAAQGAVRRSGLQIQPGAL